MKTYFVVAVTFSFWSLFFSMAVVADPQKTTQGNSSEQKRAYFHLVGGSYSPRARFFVNGARVSPLVSKGKDEQTYRSIQSPLLPVGKEVALYLCVIDVQKDSISKRDVEIQKEGLIHARVGQAEATVIQSEKLFDSPVVYTQSDRPTAAYLDLLGFKEGTQVYLNGVPQRDTDGIYLNIYGEKGRRFLLSTPENELYSVRVTLQVPDGKGGFNWARNFIYYQMADHFKLREGDFFEETADQSPAQAGSPSQIRLAPPFVYAESTPKLSPPQPAPGSPTQSGGLPVFSDLNPFVGKLELVFPLRTRVVLNQRPVSFLEDKYVFRFESKVLAPGETEEVAVDLYYEDPKTGLEITKSRRIFLIPGKLIRWDSRSEWGVGK